MNTRQKLTLGIAAIFMVTLTIVGVTYAYFVTIVDTQQAADVDVKTANVGSVEYLTGNGTNDFVSLDNVLPDTTLYKTFRVHNNSTDTTSSSQYNLFITSTPTASTAQFVHGTNDSTCYTSAANPSTAVDNDETQDINEGPTAACFDGTAYNNVKVSLYKVDQAIYDSVAADGKSIANASALTADNAVVQNVPVAAIAGTAVNVATQDLTTAGVNIAGDETQYYVLKVVYENNGKNQNIENNAALTIKASIK